VEQLSVTSRTLSRRDVFQPAASDQPATDVEQLVLEALKGSVCVAATYNRGSVVLEPVLLFREHEALFLIASTIERNGQAPREPKLGTFRLSGLTDVRVTERAIGPSPILPDDWDAGRPTRTLVSIAGLIVSQMKDS
jgi:hypothetical protein